MHHCHDFLGVDFGHIIAKKYFSSCILAWNLQLAIRPEYFFAVQNGCLSTPPRVLFDEAAYT